MLSREMFCDVMLMRPWLGSSVSGHYTQEYLLSVSNIYIYIYNYIYVCVLYNILYVVFLSTGH